MTWTLLAVFVASLVEAVEAFTIVLAVGVSQGWRCALYGTLGALAVLSAGVGLGGVALLRYMPAQGLQVGAGLLLGWLGVTWLRKAILRASGRKAKHDEDKIYAETLKETRSGLAVAFGGVLTEGFEVVLVLAAVAMPAHQLVAGSLVALAAVGLVTLVGLAVSRQLREVPENALKMGVAVLLCAFAVFWLGEGVGLSWPGSDGFVPALIAAFAGLAAVSVRRLRTS